MMETSFQQYAACEWVMQYLLTHTDSGTSMPTIDNLVILAAMLGVTMDEIIVVDTVAIQCG